ncbi:MAG: N-acetylneuraminate synthase [Deltaproteobacteria bacterium]|nr:N-acetylneuraminate synthase [Deltaproteobacteria bacterium]
MKKTFIIAEAGVNHNGSLDLAKKMIDSAADCGVDAVKFQTFKAEKVVSKFTPKAEYQKEKTKTDESHLEMIKKLELNAAAHQRLITHCNKKKIQFLSSPFDLGSIDLLNELGLNIFKIPSGEITNLPYLRKIGSLKKEIILSTGMADLYEIEDALNVLTNTGAKLKDITILHCNTEYPTPIEDVNLKAMLTIKSTFPGVNIGYSDHTLGIEIPIAAVSMGATVIEKHFTLDKNMEGPDHKASLDPSELKAMVCAIRNIERAMGNGIKKPSPSELKNKLISRKSIVACRDIHKGELFTEENLTVKRPGTGINPMRWDEIIGQKAKRDYQQDELI